jgi:hypothetical protein
MPRRFVKRGALVVSCEISGKSSIIIGNVRSTRSGPNTGTAVPLIKREELAEKIA